MNNPNKLEGASQQSAALEEEGLESGKAAPRFYVAGRNDRAGNMTGGAEEPADKRARRESKKDMMARKKREHTPVSSSSDNKSSSGKLIRFSK